MDQANLRIARNLAFESGLAGEERVHFNDVAFAKQDSAFPVHPQALDRLQGALNPIR